MMNDDEIYWVLEKLEQPPDPQRGSTSEVSQNSVLFQRKCTKL